MPNFFARVELHRATWPEDYVTLHAALKKIGFSTCIGVQSTTTKELSSKTLPTGSYYAVNSKFTSNANALDAVKRAADSTGFKSEIILIEASGFRCLLSREC